MYRLDPLTSGVKLRPSPRPEDRSYRTSMRTSQPSRQARVNSRARLDLDHARLDLGGEETEDGHAFSSGGPSGQSRKRPYLYLVHPSGSDEPGHLD